MKENPFGGRCSTENTAGSSKSPLCPTDPADCPLYSTETEKKKKEWHLRAELVAQGRDPSAQSQMPALELSVSFCY